MKSSRTKSSKASRDVLYVPFYLRHFNVCEKTIIVLSIFISSIAVSSIPLAVIALSSTQTPEQASTRIYSSEAELSGIVGHKK